MTEDDAKKLANAIVDVVFERLSARLPAFASPQTDEREPKYMKVCDFARASGFSRATIQEYVKRGMPAIQLGKRGHRIDVHAAREWLKIGGAATRDRGGMHA